MGSVPDVTGVETASNCRVRRALDDGATVRKERDLVGWAVELQHKSVVADLTQGFETSANFGKIHGPLAFVNLDRIAAAERDMRPAFTGQMNEVALTADAASGAW